MAQLSAKEAHDLRNRICWLGNFYELGFFDLPLRFSEARFKVNSISPACSLKDFLKEWDVRETSARPKSSVADGGAAGDDACSSDKVDTNCREFKLALERLNTTLSLENIEALEKVGKMTNLPEDQILVGVGVHLIRKLTGTAETSWSRSQIQCPCKCGVKLDHSNTMYIGSEVTLHGELDIRSLVGITAAEKIPDYVDEEDTSLERRLSNGSVNVEFEKKSDDRPGLQQVIAQAITYGWTEYNRHRQLSPYIPSLFIDGTKFGMFVYNPKLDSLFVCECPLMYITGGAMKPHDKYSGIFILWLILHYRLFFRKETVYENSNRYCCRFKEHVRIQSYEELKDYSVCVRGHTDGIQWGPAKLGLWAEERKRRERKRKHSDSDGQYP